MAVTISCALRKIVSARSTVTAVSIGRRSGRCRDALGQPRIVRVGTDQVVVVGRAHCANVGEGTARGSARPGRPGRPGNARGPARAGPPPHTHSTSPGEYRPCRPPRTQIKRMIGNGMPRSQSNRPRPMTSSGSSSDCKITERQRRRFRPGLQAMRGHKRRGSGRVSRVVNRGRAADIARARSEGWPSG